MSIFNLGAGGGAPTLEARTVTPSTSQQIIKPSRDEYDGLSQVTVEATPLETRTINPSTSSQTITPSGSNIGFSTITVNPYRLQSKSSAPSSLPFTYFPDSGYNGLSKVTVTKPIDFLKENIILGKTVFGMYGNAPIINKYYLKRVGSLTGNLNFRMCIDPDYSTISTFVIGSKFRIVSMLLEANETKGQTNIINRIWYADDYDSSYFTYNNPTMQINTALSQFFESSSWFISMDGFQTDLTFISSDLQLTRLSTDQYKYANGSWSGTLVLVTEG